MENSNVQSQMDFILEQQAKVVVNLEKLTEDVQKLTKDVQKLTEAQVKAEARLGQVEDRVGNLESAVVTVVGLVGELTRSQQGTDTKLRETMEKVDALSERIDAFISLLIEREHGEQKGNGKKDHD